MATYGPYVNTSEAVTADDVLMPPYDSYKIFYILELLICSLGIPGNIATIIILGSSARLRRKPVNCFLIHQSAVDLWICVMAITEAVLNEFDIPPIPLVCHILSTKWTSSMGLVVSTYNLTFMIIERSFAIVDPFKYDSKKVLKRMPFVFLSIYLLAFAHTLWIPSSTNIIYGLCFKVYHMLYTTYFIKVVAYQMILINVLIPITIIIICNTRMLIALNESQEMLKKSVGVAKDDKSSKVLHNQRMAQINLFKTCFIVSLIFVICWGIDGAALFVITLDYTAPIHFKRAGFVFIIFNCCLNPYVYAIQYRDFQEQARKLFGRKTKGIVESSTNATAMSNVQ